MKKCIIQAATTANATARIVFGRISQFTPERKFGIAIVRDFGGPGKSRSFSLSTENGPFSISSGGELPAFARLERSYPRKGAYVVLEIIGVNGSVRVRSWGCAHSYKGAQAAIAARPVYRVIRDNRIGGRFATKSMRDQEVFKGTLQQMERESRRDGLPVSANDKFAPVYETAIFACKNRFERRNADGSWSPCEDPRRFPATGPVFRLQLRAKDGSERTLAKGQALVINLTYPRGAKDPLLKYISDETGSGEYLYWSRREPDSFDRQKTVWVETHDPRPALTRPSATRAQTVPAGEPKANPVAMPRSNKPKKVVLKSFAALGELALMR